MNPNAKTKLADYYHEVSSRLQTGPSPTPVAYIVVAHVLPDAPVFIRAIGTLGRIAAVIPKTSYRDTKTFHALQAEFPVPFPETYLPNEKPKDQLRDPTHAVAFLQAHRQPGEKLIILDHGGYFANAYDAMHADTSLREAILGITEATENGHQKYQLAMAKKLLRKHGKSPSADATVIPVYSRARSKLKAPEDHNVGVAMVHSTENILRNIDGERIEDCKHIGVFGFGKIGRAIAQKLQREGLPVTICEQDPKTAALAFSMGFNVTDKASLLKKSTLLFCATGNKILRNDDWLTLQNGVYVASATSADDEFDTGWLKQVAACVVEKDGENYAYTLPNGQVVNLLMNGEAVNFVDKSVLGPSVFLPEAETLVLAAYLRNHLALPASSYAQRGRKRLQPAQLPVEYKNAIAAIWMKHFGGLDMTTHLTWPKH